MSALYDRLKQDLTVVDGDTLRTGDDLVRVTDLDAPEAPGRKGAYFQPGEAGHEVATDWMEQALPGVDKVEERGTDLYGRLLATLEQDGESLGVKAVRAGVAAPTLKFSGDEHDTAMTTSLANRITGNRTEWDDRMDAARAENPPQVKFGSTLDRGYQPEGTFSKAVDRGWANLKASVGAAGNYLGEKLGIDALAEGGADMVANAMVEAALNPAEVESFEDADTLSEYGTWAIEKLGETLPNMATMIGGAGIGGLATAGVGKALLKKAVTDAAKKSLSPKWATWGARIGAVGATYPVHMGEAWQELRDAGVNPEDTNAPFLTATINTVLDVAPMEGVLRYAFKGLDPEMAKDLVKQATKQMDAKGILAEIAKGAGRGGAAGFAMEAPTELAQEIVNLTARAYHDPEFSWDDPKVHARLKEAFAAGGVVGAAMGGSGRASTQGYRALKQWAAQADAGIEPGPGGDAPAPNAAAGDNLVNRDSQVVDSEPAVDEVVNLTPAHAAETDESLMAQVDALAAKKRKGVLISENQPESPATQRLERGVTTGKLTKVVVPGKGTMYVEPGAKAQALARAVLKNDAPRVERLIAELSPGVSADVADAHVAGQSDRVVQARDDQGRVVAQAGANAENEAKVAEQLAPQGSTETVTAEQAFEDNRAPAFNPILSPKEEEPAPVASSGDRGSQRLYLARDMSLAAGRFNPDAGLDTATEPSAAASQDIALGARREVPPPDAENPAPSSAPAAEKATLPKTLMAERLQAALDAARLETGEQELEPGSDPTSSGISLESDQPLLVERTLRLPDFVGAKAKNPSGARADAVKRGMNSVRRVLVALGIDTELVPAGDSLSYTATLESRATRDPEITPAAVNALLRAAWNGELSQKNRLKLRAPANEAQGAAGVNLDIPELVALGLARRGQTIADVKSKADARDALLDALGWLASRGWTVTKEDLAAIPDDTGVLPGQGVTWGGVKNAARAYATNEYEARLNEASSAAVLTRLQTRLIRQRNARANRTDFTGKNEWKALNARIKYIDRRIAQLDTAEEVGASPDDVAVNDRGEAKVLNNEAPGTQGEDGVENMDGDTREDWDARPGKGDTHLVAFDKLVLPTRGAATDVGTPTALVHVEGDSKALKAEAEVVTKLLDELDIALEVGMVNEAAAASKIDGFRKVAGTVRLHLAQAQKVKDNEGADETTRARAAAAIERHSKSLSILERNIELLEDIARTKPKARVVFLRDSQGRVTPWIYMSGAKAKGMARKKALLHEVGHIVLRAAADSASPEAISALREALGGEDYTTFEENFANAFLMWAEKKALRAAIDPASQRIKDLVVEFFDKLWAKLRKLWLEGKEQLEVDETFAEFMEGVINRKRRREGEKEVLSHSPYNDWLASMGRTRFLRYQPGAADALDFTPADVARRTARSALRNAQVRKLGRASREAGKFIASIHDRHIRGFASWLHHHGVGWLADDFKVTPGRARKPGQTIPMRMRSEGARFINRITKLADDFGPKYSVKNLLTGGSFQQISATYRAVQKALVNEQSIAPGELGYAEWKATREVFDNLHDWLRGKGVRVAYRKNYFPFIFGKTKLREAGAREAFAEAVVRWAKVVPEEARLYFMANNLSDTDLSKPENIERRARQLARGLYDMAIADGMSLNRIENANDFEIMSPGFDFKGQRRLPPGLVDALTQFREDDVFETLFSYAHAAVKRGVWQERYGLNEVLAEIDAKFAAARDGKGKLAEAVKFQKEQVESYKERGVDIYDPAAKLVIRLQDDRKAEQISDDDLQFILDKVIPGLQGRLGADMNPVWRRFQAFMLVYQNWRVLSMGVFAQMIDFGLVLNNARGVRFEALRSALKVFVDKNTREELMRLAHDLGAVRDDTMEHILNDESGVTLVDARLRRLNEALFRWNGMHKLTNIGRAWALGVGKTYLHHIVRTNAADEAARLGVTIDQIKDWMADHEPTTWSERHDAVQGALHQFIDEGILRPDAGSRPVLGNDQRFALFWHLKSFPWEFTHTVLMRHIEDMKKRWGEEEGLRKATALMPMMTLAAFSILFAGLGMEMRWLIAPPGKRPEGGWDYAIEAIQRSGLTGYIQLLIDADTATEHHRFPLFAALGPSVSQLDELWTKGSEYDPVRALPAYAAIRGAASLIERMGSSP